MIANRELEKFKEGKIIDANYVTDSFERALAFGTLKAAEFLIPVYLTGKDGFPKREVRAKIIIKCFNTPKYKFYLSKDNSYCNFKEYECGYRTLNYKFSHPFGIITKKDAMRYHYVHTMMLLNSATLGPLQFRCKRNS